MRKSLLLLSAATLAGCGQSNDTAPTNQAAAQPKKKPAYCFFKNEELKGWAAKRDKDGNISVKGKAHVKDPRYKAELAPPEITGTTATLSPTIGQNDTGYSAVEDTWDLGAVIPNSASIATIIVACGDKTVAQLQVQPKG